MRKTIVILFIFVFSITKVCFAQVDSVSFTDILKRYHNLSQLSVLPENGEESSMFSSYDRNSKYNAENDIYMNWRANYDGDGFIRMEDDKFVLAHIKGTGMVNRIWSAKPETGNITIEIDGKDVLSLPAENLFNGDQEPFNFPGFVYISAKGCNNYIPICFQKECKIKAEKDWGKFYQINYFLFPEGTVVPAFKGFFSKSEQVLLTKTEEKIGEARNIIPYKNQIKKAIKKDITINPRERKEIFSVLGAMAIARLEIDLLKNDYLDDLLRNLEIEIYWDDNTEPAVKCPLGAFFGATIHEWNRLSEFSSVPLGMVDKKMYSNWHMPFKKKASIVLINKGIRKINIKGNIQLAENKHATNEFGYFHLKWNNGLKKIEEERWPDRLLLDIKGKGRFCGMMLTVLNPLGGQENGYDLPMYNAQWWWGEGDEKFYVDGEKFPSTFGTGTEDYFGYAWGWPQKFSKPFHCQTYTTAEGLSDIESNAPQYVQNGNRVVSMNRFQISDNVPFQRSFFATLEQYYPDERPIKFQTALFYYLNHP